MAGHKIDVILCVSIHATTFGNNIANVFMILFQTSFLIGNIRVTVEYIGSVGSGFGLFNIPWIFKFRTIVRQNYRKILLKGSDAKNFGKIIYCFDYASLIEDNVSKRNKASTEGGDING